MSSTAPTGRAMTDTVRCPECHQPARVLDGFTSERASGPVRYLRLQCEGPLSFLVTVDDTDVKSPVVPPARELADGAE